MIKKIVLGVLVLLSSQLFSQENTASPYSFYGLGDARFKGMNDVVSMGGLSVYSDSIHLNVLNPASYANQMLTSIQIGGTSSFYKLKSSVDYEQAKKTTLDYLVIGLPYSKKLGFSFGLLPHSAVGYRLVKNQYTGDVLTQSNVYNGTGGINKVYFGAGYQLTSKLSFGADFQYLFGSIDTKSILLLNGVQYSTRELNNSVVSGVAFNTGLLYKTKVHAKYTLTTSLTFSPETKLNSVNTRNTATVTFNSAGAELIANSQEVVVPDSKMNIPSKLALGAGLGNRKWFIGADYTRRGTSTQTNRFDNYNNVRYENSSKIAIGGYFIPKFDSFQSYFQRVTYKAGFRYENTGLVINNTSIKDKAISFGFAFPITGTFSSINIGSEIGSRGTSSNGLIKENYFTINIGLMFSDKWFKKNLYN